MNIPDYHSKPFSWDYFKFDQFHPWSQQLYNTITDRHKQIMIEVENNYVYFMEQPQRARKIIVFIKIWVLNLYIIHALENWYDASCKCRCHTTHAAQKKAPPLHPLLYATEYEQNCSALNILQSVLRRNITVVQLVKSGELSISVRDKTNKCIISI